MSGLVLVFDLAGRRAALPTADVHSVIELDTVSPVPRAPPHVLGLSALRSNTLTVIDAAAALGVAAPAALREGARVAIVEHAGHRYALVVDAIDDVAATTGEPVAVPGEIGAGWQQASEGLVETDRGPALLVSLAALLAGPAARAA